jgi:CheY-like chemotaxis protein
MSYKADMAVDGIEVLQALERKLYDLASMDVSMPETDGIKMRTRWPTNGPKIIAIAAYALEGDREKYLEAGMDDYIASLCRRKSWLKC